MTSEMASRLTELRKKANLSQEELAAKIGVSRQSVSKWECGDSSPDTDNLIALAKLYNVSIDDIVCNNDKTHKNIKVDLPFIHVFIGDDAKTDSTTKTDDYGDWVESEVVNDNGVATKHWNWKQKRNKHMWNRFPYPVLALVAYLSIGFLWNIWDMTWLIFLTIPLYYWLGSCIEYKKFPSLSVTGIITVIYLVLGIWKGLWHPYWILFLTIPIFEFFVKAFKREN